VLKQFDRKQARQKRHRRVRVRVRGTAERPRLAVFRSLNHFYVHLLDDLQGRTLASPPRSLFPLLTRLLQPSATVRPCTPSVACPATHSKPRQTSCRVRSAVHKRLSLSHARNIS